MVPGECCASIRRAHRQLAQDQARVAQRAEVGVRPRQPVPQPCLVRAEEYLNSSTSCVGSIATTWLKPA